MPLRGRPVHYPCSHPTLATSLSPHGKSTSHQSYSNTQILNAMTGRRKHSPSATVEHRLDAFPDPLVLPGDAIDLDPKYPPQSFRSWLNLDVRNQVTTRRSVIYVAAPPEIDESVGFMESWCIPKAETIKEKEQTTIMTDLDVHGIISYLRAFYHGLEVKLLPSPLIFTAWDDAPTPKPKSKPKAETGKERDVQAVALSTGAEAIRIRVRCTPPPNSESPERVYPYSHQVDLNDMIDVALSVLPTDAYALLLLTKHDMYESDDDDFCCGRAWGASLVAIVSGARYQPCLDNVHGIDEEHIWPASHCKDFVDKMSLVDSQEQMVQGQAATRKRKLAQAHSNQTQANCSPLEKAVEAHRTTVLVPDQSTVEVQGTFLYRLCRTVSHELGHCFGLDHCMYKACMMQGTASVAEDMRQPPYLCPVCEAKIAYAIVQRDISGADSNSKASLSRRDGLGECMVPSGDDDRKTALGKWKEGRHAALKAFCEQYTGAFTPLHAWSTAFLDAEQHVAHHVFTAESISHRPKRSR